MAKGRASNRRIVVLSNSLAGKPVDITNMVDGKMIVYDQAAGVFVFVDPMLPEDVTFETLQANGDVGSGADQLGVGNHDHDLGDLVVLFDNRIA